MRDYVRKSLSFLKHVFKHAKTLTLRIINDRGQIVSVWLIALLLSSTVTVLATNVTASKLEYKNAVSIFNLSDSDLIFQESEQVLNLPTFEAYTRITNEKESFSISTSDNNQQKKEFTFEDKKSKLFLYVASEDNRYCFVNADVTSLYYNTEDKNRNPQSVTILSTTPSPMLEAALDWNKYDYVFPGRYFPSQINYNSENKRLIGFYPIECKSVTNSATVAEIITFYKTFRAEVERDILQKELDKLK
ncbi:MAG: hypothetical protein ABI721_01355 [Candidatus Dojkabacteria bacterium]